MNRKSSKILFSGPLRFSLILIFICSLSFNNNAQQFRYDSKCKEKVKYVLTENYKVGKLHNEYGIDLSKLEEFSHRYYLFEKFMHYMRYYEYKTKPHDSISSYVEAIKNNIKIEDVLLTKLVPKNQKSFLEKEYRNLTMGSIKVLKDLDQDKIPEILISSASTRCTKNVKIFYFKTSSIDITKNRNYIEDIAIEVTDEDTIYQNNIKSNIVTYRKNSSTLEPNNLYRGKLQNVINLNNKIINQNEIHSKKNNLFLDNKNRLIVSKNSLINDNFILNINVNDKLKIFNKKNLSEINLKEFKNINFDNISCMQTIDDFNDNNIKEFLVCNGNIIYLIETFRSSVKILIINTNMIKPEELSFGSIGDFNADQYKDIWLSNKNYKDLKSNKIVGHLSLINGKLLLDALNADKKKIKLEKLIIKEIFGSSLIPSTDSSGINGPSAGISYSLSKKAGDHDNDGIKDLVVLHHYSYSNSGSLHILLGKNIDKLSKRSLINKKDFTYIIGNFSGYLGPGLLTGYDFDNDSYDDILVGADVDHEAGYSSGALYVLSGRRIFQ